MKRTLDICYIALFVAIIAICSWISIPIANIPYTLQVLGVLVCAGLLGWKKSLIALLAYLLLGAVGVPVFSGFTSGLFTAPSRGYIIGFLFTAVIVGLGYKIQIKNPVGAFIVHFLFMTLGVLVCYAFGTAWFMIYMQSADKAVTLSYALSVCVLPYLWFDAVKIVVSIILINRLLPYIK